MKLFARITLVGALVLSLGVIGFALWSIGPGNKEAWAVVAAALAVLTSVISSWAAQKTVELQEDSQKPYPYPSIDVSSRYLLLQLRVINFGGSAAHDIRIIWDTPLTTSKGNAVRFTKQEGAPDIPVLLPKESVAVLIESSPEFYKAFSNTNYSGHIEFQDATGKRLRHRFFVSGEKYRESLLADSEELLTHRELQKIPKAIETLTSEVEKIRKRIDESSPPSSP